MLINGQRSSQEDSFDAEDDMQNAVLRSRMSTRSQDASDLVGNNESVLRKGFLDKCKPSSVKKWKKCYFVLNAREQRLYLFEDNTTIAQCLLKQFLPLKRRKKPKDLIDMQDSQVYPIDSSLSDRNFGFQLVTRFPASSSESKPTILYLAAISASERQEWMSSLMMCQGSFPFSSSVGQLLEQKSVEKLMEHKSRECNNLYLEIKEVLDVVSPKVYSWMPPAQQLFILIQLDDIPYAKTCSLDQIRSQWCTFQKFCFKKLPSELKTVRLVLMSSKAKKGSQDLGCGVISLQQLPKNVLHCAKYSLTPVLRNLPGSGGGGGGGSTTTCGGGGGGYSSTLPPTHMGTVRCEIFLKHLTILPEEMYANLQQCLLSSEGPELLYQLGFCLPVDDRNFYALLLLKTYLHLRSEIGFIVKLNAIEIRKENDQTSLFRSQSLAVSVMENYLSIVMQPFVQRTLQPIINDIIFDPDIAAGGPLASGGPANSTALGGTQDPERWISVAKKYLHCLADSILGQVDEFPTNLRYVLQQIKMEVEEKWPPKQQQQSSHMNGATAAVGGGGGDRNQIFRYKVIASFIFLRCISLALCTPRKYNLIIGSPPNIGAVQELLKLLAKLLQSWANFTPLKEHQGFQVHSLNNYLKQNQERMEGFLEGVSTSPQGAHHSSHDVVAHCDLAEKFASVHRLCCDNHTSLKKYSFSTPSLKKLLFIIEEISERSGHSLEA
ncbi:ras GTPase-activating protein 1-like [Convolutriloba macropyga]|uniref:ras GTPase-activating protein 1-like n=1 Tax=Convolutriloba macropyga TaxID=536237 RepID=UPI003F51D0B1